MRISREELEERRSFDESLEQLRNQSISELRDYAEDIRPRYRDDGCLEDAAREYEKVRQAFYERLDVVSGINHRDLDRLEFELGYVEFLRGRYSSSTDYFRSSGENARKAGNPVGHAVATFRVLHNQVFDEVISFSDARVEMESVLNLLSTLYIDDPSNGLARNFIFNIKGRLFDLDIELQEAEKAQTRHAQLAADEMTQEALASGNTDKIAATELAIASREARISMISELPEQALAKFAKFIAVAGLDAFGSINESWLKVLPSTQEMSRDFLFTGDCLRETGKYELAEVVYLAGLDQSPELANHYYQVRLRRGLRQESP